MLESLQKLRQHLLTGVSYAIPFIACGGILIALPIALRSDDSFRPRFLKLTAISNSFSISERPHSL